MNVASLPGHRRGRLCDARWALGLWLPHRRGGRLRRRGGRCGLRRRGGLRHLLRGAHPAHGPRPRRHRCGPRSPWPRRSTTASPPGWAAPAPSTWIAGAWMPCSGAAPAGRWSRGYGRQEDLDRIEERGCMAGADPDKVSDHAKKRQQDEMGTLGSGNHYLEVQEVTARLCRRRSPTAFGLRVGDIMVSIHCGSRGLGHQIGTEYLKRMAIAAAQHGIRLPDRELACAPIDSALGQRLPGRHARRHQLRPGQPPDHHPPGPQGLRRALPGAGAAPPLRRLPQHLQGGGAPGRRPPSAGSMCTARGPPAPSDPATRTSRETCATQASRC